MLPVQKPQPTYRTLEEIRQRKDELLEQMQNDNKQFSTTWNQLFVKREDTSKGDYIASLVANSVTVIDLFLLYRKLRKSYGGIMGLFGKGKKKESEEIFTAAPEEAGTGIGSMPDFYGAPETAGEPAAAPEGEAIPLGGPVEEKAGETAEEKAEEKKDDFDESIFIP